jgi:hypothetical protein
MKKFTIILTILFAISIKLNAQIPNSGFENWRTVGNCIEPTSWYSPYSLMDSTGNYTPISKSTDHYPANIGSYSARIVNDTARFNSGTAPSHFLGWGFLSTPDEPLFHVTGHLKALCGYYKFLPQNGDTMNIDFHFYKQTGIEITMGHFQSNVAAPNWTPFKVFVSDTLYSGFVDSARIGFGPCNEPKNGHGGPRGNSVLYIDNLSFDNLLTTSIPEQTVQNKLFNLYPNPAFDIVNLNIDNTKNADLTLNIYNVIGELVSSELLKQNQQQINIGDLNNGIYIVEIKSYEWSGKQKLIIQR